MSSITQRGSSGAFLVAYCPNCSLADPGGHGLAPRDAGDVAIVAMGVVILLFALILSVRLLFRPGEGSPTHVKWTILDDTVPPRGRALSHE
jgi:hypothetical protein